MPPRKPKTFQQARATVTKKQMAKLTNAKVSRAMVVNKQEVQRRKLEKAEKEEKKKQAREQAEASAVVGDSHASSTTKRAREESDAGPKSPSPVENLDDMFPRAPDAEPKTKKRRVSGGSKKTEETEKTVEEPAKVPDTASEAVEETEKESRSSATDDSAAKTDSPSCEKPVANAADEPDAVANASESNTTAAANPSSSQATPKASPIPLRRIRIPAKTNSALMPSPSRRKRPAPSPITPGRAPLPTTVKTRMGELIELGPVSSAESSPGASSPRNDIEGDGPSRLAYVPNQAQKRVSRMNKLIAQSRRSYGKKGAGWGQGGTRAG
ncbi:uncharacterized protein J3D65DRAFT_675196 [Phyllosticta citribraziliensis]|uniref:Uncharacterized protein n=1 Tax=Phyllosticta citribraziliensis TaxID=989973 RepID=A0ABR1M2E2_9PEZI